MHKDHIAGTGRTLAGSRRQAALGRAGDAARDVVER